MAEQEPSIGRKIKELVIGEPRSPRETGVFHKISLVAFFAWIGLGSDGLSSSCYGPAEAFLTLVQHPYLSIVVAGAMAVTIFIIASSYTQIIEMFPSGGGGYLVASKLLSPNVGMVAGCALMVDYVLTIAVSVASGADALFALAPAHWLDYKLAFAIVMVVVLTVMNLRGVRESVGPLVPIFLIFLLTHAFVIVYALVYHFVMPNQPPFWQPAAAGAEAGQAAPLTALGMLLLVLRAFSMGSGTFTGIEAVSNAMPVLREPRVRTAKRTMTYMWASLAVTVVGLMVAYLAFNVASHYRMLEVEGKTEVIHRIASEASWTVNGTLLHEICDGWPWGGAVFIFVALVSEGALLFVAAQTGFLGGPRVLANMALDRWFPSRLSMLSDRLVTHNGIVLMSAAALATMLLTKGSVEVLVTIYSINVFITFALSQTGMVRHWWRSRGPEGPWRKKLFINGVGLVLTLFILVTVTALKFAKGGWATLVVTGALIALACGIKRHYTRSRQLLDQFDSLALAAVAMPTPEGQAKVSKPALQPDPSAKTAVLLVTGFNGLGIHALMNVFRFFGDTFRNFVFLRVGVVDAENFKGADEVQHLEQFVRKDTEKYVEFMRRQGYYAEAVTSVGADVVDEVEVRADKIVKRFPQAIFFAGQMLFPNETFLTRVLHNNITFALQRRLYHKGIPFMMLPIRVQAGPPGKALRRLAKDLRKI